MLDQFVKFCQEAIQELKLSTWLTRQQMLQSTLVVIILTLIVAAYVSIVDRIMLWIANILFRLG